MGSPRRTALTDILVARIARDGPLTFAAFMEACLYDPAHGYYTRRVPERGQRDYVSSPEVGPLFARLLGWQFDEMWEALGRPARFELVECGAGRGALAAGILESVHRQAPDFAAALRVTLVETSLRLREQAQAALEGQGERVAIVERLPAGVAGCLLSNELVDALPVHRVVQRGNALREIYVSARSGELVETEGDPSSPALARFLERYGAPLEDGQQAEINLAALDWLEQAAAALERGFLLTIDYGYRARELYGAAHQRGTLLAYSEHRTSEDWLSKPGEQDLTAHVDFTALEERGSELGLASLGYVPQAQFLLALARASGLVERLEREAETPEARAARNQLKQLIHPEGMGEAFKVLLQGKGVAGARWSGLQPL